MKVVDPKFPFSYVPATPPTYVCGRCGAARVKLWRKFSADAQEQTLLCADCAAKEQGANISAMGADGFYVNARGDRTDQIGSRMPAVPTEENDGFWQYVGVPPAGVAWWRSLPLR